jgi:saccharopine dehydrogenase-like NADP-dependent oxidoreductase
LYNFEKHYILDVSSKTEEEIAVILINQGATHVINAMPFRFNQKIASAAVAASCHYIDFTEDDVMADKVQEIYKNSGLTCAVKCGLAPGFVNYIGYDLVGKVKTPETLMISVGALPRSACYDRAHPALSYNLSWSVDGLVNEYIRPCRIKRNGEEIEVPALGDLVTVVLDGIEYEAAFTSGGVGSLVRDLKDVPNIYYKTLRYPGHYKYVRSVVQDTYGNFNKIRDIFTKTFPFTDDDVIVVYADVLGKDELGVPVRKVYFNKFYGVDGLTGIQSTTAGSGVAMLELMIQEKVSGIVNHSQIDLGIFTTTDAFKAYYQSR